MMRMKRTMINMSRQRKRHLSWHLHGGFLAVLLLCTACFVSGCVNQHPEGEADSKTQVLESSVETMLEITDPQEKEAVKAAKTIVQAMGTEPRIIATSPATAEICDR